MEVKANLTTALDMTEDEHDNEQENPPIQKQYTVFLEIFRRALFSLNFAVGVGLRKLNQQNYCTCENLES